MASLPRVHAFVEIPGLPRVGDPFVWGNPRQIGRALVNFRPDGAESRSRLRQLPDDWLEQAVRRYYTLCPGTAVTREEFIAVILGPEPEPEPEEWEIEAAAQWYSVPPNRLGSLDLARHFAKARREAGK